LKFCFLFLYRAIYIFLFTGHLYHAILSKEKQKTPTETKSKYLIRCCILMLGKKTPNPFIVSLCIFLLSSPTVIFSLSLFFCQFMDDLFILIFIYLFYILVYIIRTNKRTLILFFIFFQICD
jgi:hypothetical protein